MEENIWGRKDLIGENHLREENIWGRKDLIRQGSKGGRKGHLGE